MKIFVSGSCRLLTSIHDGRNKVNPIHTMFHNFTGINFLGKLHNIKQHIQFIKFIKDEISIPDYIFPKFFTSYNEYCMGHKCDDLSLLSKKKENIKNEFNECEWYLFEICSLKLYKNNGFEVQFEHTSDYESLIQTENELLEDLYTLKNLIPNNKKILFQVHFRPNIIYKNNSLSIDKREIIYNVVNEFCKNNENTFIYDPSIIIQSNNSLYDGDTHFNSDGLIQNFNYIYDNYLSK